MFVCIGVRRADGCWLSWPMNGYVSQQLNALRFQIAADEF